MAVNKKDISDLETHFNIKLPESYIEAVLNCPDDFDEEHGPILYRDKEQLIDFNQRLRNNEALKAKGNYFGIVSGGDDWLMIDLTVDNSEVIYFDSSTESFEEILNYENVNAFVDHVYRDRKELEEMNRLDNLSDSEIAKEYYEEKVVAHFASLAESFYEFVDIEYGEDVEISDEKSNQILQKAMAELGHENMDMQKLNKSYEYYLFHGDLERYPEYAVDSPDFGKYF